MSFQDLLKWGKNLIELHNAIVGVLA
jgi:hypothetical protein